MPTNLPPDYYDVEKQYRAAKTPAEKIGYLEEMLSIVPKHKGTDHLRADLRKKLSKLKTSPGAKKGVSRRDASFRIDREGAGQVVILGPANVGKSALVAALTNATPEVSPSPYTTWKPTPGMMPVENIQVQLVDTPPLDREFVEPVLVDMIRRSDLILLVVDLSTDPIQQLEDTINVLVEQGIIPEHMQGEFAEDRRLVFKPLVVLANKNDDSSTDENFDIFRELCQNECTALPVSAATGRNLDEFKSLIYRRLEILRVYTRAPGNDPDYNAPFVLKKGDTVEDLAGKIHQDFVEELKSARVWGETVYDGQMVGRDYVLQDGDVVELQT
jgi:ribosome-interacting GTPase 1